MYEIMREGIRKHIKKKNDEIKEKKGEKIKNQKGKKSDGQNNQKLVVFRKRKYLRRTKNQSESQSEKKNQMKIENVHTIKHSTQEKENILSMLRP